MTSWTTNNLSSIAGDVEIRRLQKQSPSHYVKLIHFLEENESWRILMSIVPKDLRVVEHDPTQPNSSQATKETWQKLYNSAHIKILENTSKRDPRSPSEIFLFEWALTGIHRPNVLHLLQVLKAANLYRAADYVAIEILGRKAVDRPTTGPAAKINFDDLDLDVDDENANTGISNVTIENNLDNSKPENTICGANAPKVLIPPRRQRKKSRSPNNNASNRVEDRATARIGDVPQVQITEPTSSAKLEIGQKSSTDAKIETSGEECRVGNIILQSPPSSEGPLVNPTPDISDLIKFSKSIELRLSNQDVSDDSSNETISFSSTDSTALTNSTPYSPDVIQSQETGDILPHFSQLLKQPDKQSDHDLETIISNYSGTIDNRPNLSVLLEGINITTPGQSNKHSAGPDFSGLHIETEPLKNITSNSVGPDLSGLIMAGRNSSVKSAKSISPIEVEGILPSDGKRNEESVDAPAFSQLLGTLTSSLQTKESIESFESSSDGD